MGRIQVITAAVTGIVLSSVLVPAADAQIRDRIRERARQQAEQRTEEHADQAVDRAIDSADAAVCAVADEACIGNARAEGSEVVLTDAEGNHLSRDDYPAEALNPGEGLWTNYDFVPGERVIWAEDFSSDRVGDFPRRLVFMRGNFEVAEWRGARWLRTTGDGRFAIELPEVLPQRFTLEFNYIGGRGPGRIHFTDDERSYPRVVFYYYRGGVDGGGVSAAGRLGSADRGRVLPVRVMADGNYVKVYLGETRVANVPNADLGRSNRLVFAILASNTHPVMLGDFRIAAGGRALYDALANDGRVAVRGILFDTGSDRIRPESTPTLTEIGETLRRHASLRLRIEGHTDSVGSAEANRTLSERRAEAVRRYLIEQYGIDASRLEAAGRGDARPIDSNETPEGRQNNRRVELVRL